jgi:hypothetical protein
VTRISAERLDELIPNTIGRDTLAALRELRDLRAERDALQARLDEAVACCTLKDNRNLWLEHERDALKKTLLNLPCYTIGDSSDVESSSSPNCGCV